jgi:hypothetical protein
MEMFGWMEEDKESHAAAEMCTRAPSCVYVFVPCVWCARAIVGLCVNGMACPGRPSRMRAPQITFNSSNILLCLPFSLSSRKSCALDIAFFASRRASATFTVGKKRKLMHAAPLKNSKQDVPPS